MNLGRRIPKRVPWDTLLEVTRTHLWLAQFLFFMIRTFGLWALEETNEYAEGSAFLSGKMELCVFLEPPGGFFPQVEVAGCFCEYRGKLLFLLRNPKKPQGNTWCIPGGKLERGETPLQAILREVNEETGIKLAKDSVVYCRKVYVRFPERDLILHLFCTHIDEMRENLDIAPDEHISHRWVTVEEALEMPLIPGGGDCLRIVFKMNISYTTPGQQIPIFCPGVVYLK
jgi:mutator protein MutT